MPRPISVRLCALAALLALVTSSGRYAGAQDAPKLAADANAKLAEIQKVLAGTADKPDWQRLRIDGFVAVGKDVKVSGVFLDTGVAPKVGVFSPTFTEVQSGVEKALLALLKLEKVDSQFDWTAVTRVGAVDKDGKPAETVGRDGKPIPAPRPPHLVVQEAANKAGGEKDAAKRNPAADRLALTGARFGADGGLVLVGLRDKDAGVEKWLTGSGTDALKGHPAMRQACKCGLYSRAAFVCCSPLEEKRISETIRS